MSLSNSTSRLTECISSYSRVIPKRDSGNGGYGFHGNSTFLPVSIVPVQPGEDDQYQREISIMGRALDSVTTKRDDDSTIHTVLAASVILLVLHMMYDQC
jgi:hypothetical protein